MRKNNQSRDNLLFILRKDKIEQGCKIGSKLAFSKRAKNVFKDYCPDWTDEQFAEAEILCSGIEYATLMTANDPVTLETRINGALTHILGVFGIPEEIRNQKIQKVFAMDYRSLGKRVLKEFREYVEQANEQAFLNLLRR